MKRGWDAFRVAEIRKGRGDPLHDSDGGRARYGKIFHRYIPEMFKRGVGFDECSYWDELDESGAMDEGFTLKPSRAQLEEIMDTSDDEDPTEEDEDEEDEKYEEFLENLGD
jgi:hypothetical protein